MTSPISDEIVANLSGQRDLAGTKVFVFTKTGVDSLVDIIVYGCLTEVFAESADAFDTTAKIRERIKQKYGVK